MNYSSNLKSLVQSVDGKTNKISPVFALRARRIIPDFRSVGTVDARIPAANSAFSFSVSVRLDDIFVECVVEVGIPSVFADCVEGIAAAPVLLTAAGGNGWVFPAVVNNSKCW